MEICLKEFSIKCLTAHLDGSYENLAPGLVKIESLSSDGFYLIINKTKKRRPPNKLKLLNFENRLREDDKN